MRQPLLTIAIPTYNRALLLNQCLNALLSQLNSDLSEKIEFLVSDNHSTDNTTAIVDRHRDAGYQIAYFKNFENQGSDRNIASCFTKARGKYVWVFSDDDFLLQGYLTFVVDLLNKEEWGCIYMNTLWYSGDFAKSPSSPTSINYDIFTDPMQYIGRISYWTTFITGNIVNKSLYTDITFVHDFFDTSLVQLSWTLPAIFKGKRNAIINDKILACKADNTGGYKLLRVFGTNFNNIMDRLIVKGLINKKVKRVMNRNLLNSFFPMFINKSGKDFEQENPFTIMVPVFWNYKSFWIKIFPILFKKQFLKNVSAQ